MDGERVCALGASYGGYMINWIAGQLARPLSAAWSTTTATWTSVWPTTTPRNCGSPSGITWARRGTTRKAYEKHNPVNFVGNWKTPMLVIHGALDYRVVDTQGISTFTALQRRGIPSKLVYFPDENHWVLKPHNSILWHETVLDWLDQLDE